jgi:xanthine dehydrogenase accessory factor
MLAGNQGDGNKTSCTELGGHQYVVAPVRPPERVYIAGAGHVSQEIAPLAKHVGFHTVVIDDRENFASAERFPAAAEIFVCDEFTRIFDEASVTPGSSIVIVTRGHRFDREVLAQALRTKAGYIGMIGSARKKKSVYEALIEEGFSQKDLDRVHCPIGISIGAETPAEIAVSVVAELIQHRAVRK